MENIGHSIQQSVELLPDILRSRTQSQICSKNNMLQNPIGFHYQRQTQNN